MWQMGPYLNWCSTPNKFPCCDIDQCRSEQKTEYSTTQAAKLGFSSSLDALARTIRYRYCQNRH